GGRSSLLAMNSSVLGENTHKWKEQAAYMFDKHKERRDLEKKKMRRMKATNRSDDIPLASAGDYSILTDARSILPPYSPTAHDESFLDKLLWENAARTDASDFSLVDRTDNTEDVQTARTFTIYPRSMVAQQSSSVISKYQSSNPKPSSASLDDDVDPFSLLMKSLHAIAALAQYLLENPLILIALGSSILFLIVANA
ncbi:hypothetical protein PENTCL1PPCAC_12119, partial [Pristionchus entomophagus]